MKSFKFIHLFWLLFNNNPKPDLTKIEKKGLLAVKIGQMYALRSDFLGIEKCNHLSSLYEATGIIPTQNFEKLFETYASDILKADLDSYDPKPVASASIGQVHKGKLKSGEVVAIKIIKDDFKEKFLADVASVRRILRLIVFVYPKLKRVADPLGTLETIERLTVTELDLENEIKGIQKLQKIRDENNTKFPYLSDLRFPRIYPKYTNHKVFVSEFMAGQSFRALLDEGALSYEQLLRLFRIHGFYLFLKGEFHGDLHPGNVFLEGEAIVFLDNSNIELVPPRFGQGIVKLLFHLSAAEWKDGAATLREISKVEISDKKYKKYEEKFLALYEDFDQKKVSEVSLTNKMMETVKLAINSGMEFESGMFSVIKTLMYLDGMVIKCNPNAVLLKDVSRFRDDFKAL